MVAVEITLGWQRWRSSSAQRRALARPTWLRFRLVQVVGVGGTRFLSDIATIAAGDTHTYGELGSTVESKVPVPVQVVGVGGTGFLPGIATIAAGGDHTCAVTTTGAVYCWGYNFHGEIGDNSTTQSNVPVQVVGLGGTGLLSGIATIVAGEYHTCAQTTTGGVYCWGYNLYGQLGNNSTTESKVPVRVAGVGGSGLLSGIASIAAGETHTCTVSAIGSIDCWGNNAHGELGNNSTTNSLVPVEVTGF